MSDRLWPPELEGAMDGLVQLPDHLVDFMQAVPTVSIDSTTVKDVDARNFDDVVPSVVQWVTRLINKLSFGLFLSAIFTVCCTRFPLPFHRELAQSVS